MPVFALAVAALSAFFVVVTSATGSAAVPVLPARRVATMPHDPRAFCQGLAMHDGRLLEGTGRYRQSSLRVIDPASGQLELNLPLPNDEFGEGVTVWNHEIIQLTWRNQYLIVYDAESLQRKKTVAYRSIDRSLKEGWGITHDGTHLIVSDGSPYLRFIDPDTWKLVRRIKVTSGFRSVRNLNELEFVNGEILANVWYSSRIARIDPQSGRVIAWIELEPLRPRTVRNNRDAVLNGIAWDSTNRRLYVTGKLWPELLQISFEGLPGAAD